MTHPSSPQTLESDTYKTKWHIKKGIKTEGLIFYTLPSSTIISTNIPSAS